MGFSIKQMASRPSSPSFHSNLRVVSRHLPPPRKRTAETSEGIPWHHVRRALPLVTSDVNAVFQPPRPRPLRCTTCSVYKSPSASSGGHCSGIPNSTSYRAHWGTITRDQNKDYIFYSDTSILFLIVSTWQWPRRAVTWLTARWGVLHPYLLVSYYPWRRDCYSCEWAAVCMCVCSWMSIPLFRDLAYVTVS